MSKSVEVATWMCNVVPIVLVAKTYHVSSTLMRPGSGKFADMTGPVVDLFAVFWDDNGVVSSAIGRDVVKLSKRIVQSQPVRCKEQIMMNGVCYTCVDTRAKNSDNRVFWMECESPCELRWRDTYSCTNVLLTTIIIQSTSYGSPVTPQVRRSLEMSNPDALKISYAATSVATST